MGKRLKLTTRAFGAEDGVPEIAELAEWVAERRGTAGDIISYRLQRSLAPQISAGITSPCAGGRFYKDRVMECLTGIDGNRAICEIGVSSDRIIADAADIAGHKEGVWCALPAPHALGITDAYYGDGDEWCDAIAGVYRTLMRSMRDAGIGGHVLICDAADEAELSALVRQKVFFFQPEPDRKSLETLMEYQQQIAVGKDHLNTSFDLATQYGLHRLIVMDADDEAIALALSHLDPDQVTVGGYCCTENCDEYWKSLVDSAYYTK